MTNKVRINFRIMNHMPNLYIAYIEGNIPVQYFKFWSITRTNIMGSITSLILLQTLTNLKNTSHPNATMRTKLLTLTTGLVT